MNTAESQRWQQLAETLLPGGVDSPVRAFAAVGGRPRWFTRGAGAWLTDADGNRYVDCVASWGALLVGHAPPGVTEAVAQAARAGTSFGASTPAEVELAQQVQAAMPAVEMIRFVNSGTEAAMTALRLARGFTGRSHFIKFAGGYHGHADPFLAQAGSGVATLGLAASAGVPPEAVATTLVVPYNDADAVASVFARRPNAIAAVFVEPVAGNMGCVPPRLGFLESLRDLCRRHGALLVFDEVMTGFRVAAGGAVERYGVQPDLITLGKIIGGGLPVGALGGRAPIMRQLAPLGPVYQAGTLAGNPLAMAAGVATLGRIAELGPVLYETLERRGAALEAGLADAARSAGVPVRIQRVGSMLTVFFTAEAVNDFDQAARCDTKKFAGWHRALLEQGVFWPPSQFEAAFFGLAHGDSEIAAVVEAARRAFVAVRDGN